MADGQAPLNRSYMLPSWRTRQSDHGHQMGGRDLVDDMSQSSRRRRDRLDWREHTVIDLLTCVSVNGPNISPKTELYLLTTLYDNNVTYAY